VAYQVEIGIAKRSKWSTRESGDTAEVVERPAGGFSVVIVDGQGSGAAAKSLSLMLTAKAVSLLKDGVRDGAVARAVHDHLLAYRGGKISASLDIASVDAESHSIVVTRNGTTPFVVVRGDQDPELVLPGEGAIGRYRFTRPSVWAYPLADRLQIWLVTDGVSGAGRRSGERHLVLRDAVAACTTKDAAAEELASALLDSAVAADLGRPADDMTVAVVAVRRDGGDDLVRRLRVQALLT
jgi:serine phosphatase RsbU (regulator of sigma subunit)